MSISCCVKGIQRWRAWNASCTTLFASRDRFRRDRRRGRGPWRRSLLLLQLRELVGLLVGGGHYHRITNDGRRQGFMST